MNPARYNFRGFACWCGAAISFLFLIGDSLGQQWQFTSDKNGNTVSQRVGGAAPPQILSGPQNQVVSPGGSASFSVVAGNAAGATFQWRFQGSAIPGADTDTLLVGNVGVADEGLYSVLIFNGSGSVTSSPALLLLDSDRDRLPDSWEQSHFADLSQNPAGDFDRDGISNLDEYLDGTDPGDALSVKYRLTVLSNGGNVTLSPSRSSYTNGEVVTLTATAFAPDTFHGWTGDTNSFSSTIAVVMNTNKTVVAHMGSEKLIWTNNAGGNWNVAANWNPNFVPGPNDDVAITISATVAVSEPAECRSLTLGSSSGGNPSLSGSGILILHGDSYWRSGTMAGAGRTVVSPGVTLYLTPTAAAFLTSRTLENAGTIEWSGAANLTFNNAVLTNRPGGLFHHKGPGDFINAVASSSRFDNAGTFRKSSSSETMVVNGGIAFNNYNSVQIESGELHLNGGGVNHSHFVLSSGASLRLGSSTFNSLAGSSIVGPANLIVSGATANLAGLVNLSGTHTISGGTANLTGAYFCTNNTLTISGGAANFNGSGLVSPAVLNLSAGALGGNQLVTVLNQVNWTGGTMRGGGRTLIPMGSSVNLNPAASAFLETRTLENAGSFIWSGPRSLTFNNAVLTNRPGALFQQQGSGHFINAVASSSRFDNAGTFRKSTSSESMVVNGGIAFNNYNSVQIESGELHLNGGGVNHSSFVLSMGASLRLGSSTFNSLAGSSIVGPANLIISGATANLAGLVNLSGTHTISGGTANLTGAYFCTNNTLTISGGAGNFNGSGLVSPAVLNLSAGALGGNQLVTVLNQVNWTGGTMRGGGRTVIPMGSSVNLNPAASAFLETRTLENAGSFVWSGPRSLTFNNAVLTNRPGALFHHQGSGDFINTVASSSRFDNAGTFRKSASTDMFVINGGISFNNYGTVELRKGILRTVSAFNSSTGAVLHCSIGGHVPGTGHGQLQVAGTVTLRGSLSVEFEPGFSPATNDTFTIVSAGSRNGTFANFTYPLDQLTLQLSNTPTSVLVLVAGVPPPRPVLLAPRLVGASAVISWKAVSNTTYRLEHAASAAATNWIELPGDVTALGDTAEKSDMITPSNRVYRVRVLP